MRKGPTGEEPLPWQEAVWRSYCQGNRRIGALQAVAQENGGPGTYGTVRRFLDRQLTALAFQDLAAEERAAYEHGLLADLEEAAAVYDRAVETGDLNGQIGALRTRAAIREKLAASRGVVTKREGREHAGQVPIIVEVPVVAVQPQEQEAAARANDSGDGEGLEAEG